MRRYGKRPNYRRKAYRKTTAKKAVRKARKSNFVKAVKRVISSTVETKQAFMTSATNSLTLFNSGINAAGDMLQVLPNISQGTTDNSRIGDQIIAKKLNIKGYVKLNVNDVMDSLTLPNVICRLMVISLKYRSAYPDSAGSSAPLAALLKKGGTTTNFSGNLSDIYADVNTDLWTVHADRKFYLNQSYVATPGAAPAQSIVSTDVSKTVKFFNINVNCRNKKLLYDGAVTSGLSPTNFAPMLVLGYAYLSGDVIDTVSANVGLHYISKFDFEDA